MKGLFSEFPGSSYADWEKQVLKDLKGESPEHLVWENENGFNVKPYYSRDETNSSYEPAFTHKDWNVCVQHLGSAQNLNKNFLRDLKHGANGISFHAKGCLFEDVFKDIQLDLISVNILMEANQGQALKTYLDKNYTSKTLNIALFAETTTHQKELDDWNSLQTLFADYPGVKTVSVNATNFSSKSAFPYYELALAFTQLIETLSDSGLSLPEKDIVIRTATDCDFFVQVAKLRAYRRLWKVLSNEYGSKAKLSVMAETDENSLSVSDAYTNLLRNTLASMASVLGGCNELLVQPYDHLFHADSAFSSRLAMNQQFILKHESYFDQMGDVACGSYYIEHLTDALCEKALQSIKTIEGKGGYFKCLASGEIDQELQKQNTLKLEAIGTGKAVRVGVNKFKNEKERLSLSADQLSLLKSLAPHHPLLNYELLQFSNT